VYGDHCLAAVLVEIDGVDGVRDSSSCFAVCGSGAVRTAPLTITTNAVARIDLIGE
jgi:hypothetical protein